METRSDKPIKYRGWIPFAVAGLGILASLIMWYSLTYEEAEPIVAVLHHYIFWLILALGISLSILCAVTVKLFQVFHQQLQSYEQIKADFQKEIEERMEIEDSKQKLEKALLQGQKLQAIGTLAGGIAHDFNNILYAIRGYVEMARDDVDKETIVYKNLGKVIEASHRGQELIARILAFSRRQQHDYQPIPIQETVENVLSLLKPTIPASVVVHFQKMKNEMTILGDKTQLHQVIVNIINNAVDAMDGEGTVNIKMTRVDCEDKLLYEFPGLIHQNCCKIDISDTGHGMDQSTLDRIFEPFFTTKEVGKGTGLGLSTVHTIMEEHEGIVTVYSQLGHGTTFILLLPEYKEIANG